MDTAQQRLEQLKTAIALLPAADDLRRDLSAIARSFQPQVFRIVVFAPFNYGKSTLLNAILGEKTLPIDLIPTTGAAITVRYGPQLQTTIQFVDPERSVTSDGTDVLKQFAILDDQRRMRSDVVSVEVACPHPFLQLGVELVDLPGTDDQEAQDRLVKSQLLSADLVVQVLDGRKLMTLQERENLRDWLLDRGISTVVFVANFLNLLEAEDQKSVMNRLRFVAESFRSQLPSNVSNLYRVDALPALRGQLKGDSDAVQMSGLPIFESALQAIVQAKQTAPVPLEDKLPRLNAFSQEVQSALKIEIQIASSETDPRLDKPMRKLEIQQQAQQLIQKSFAASARELRDWLDLSQLVDRYHLSGSIALQRFDFDMWFQGLELDWEIQQRKLTEWSDKACDFFGLPAAAKFKMQWPMEPEVIFPAATTTSDDSDNAVAPVAIATGLGWVFGGPVGAAVLGGGSYLLNKTRNPLAIGVDETRLSRVQQAYDQAMQNYLTQLNTLGLAAIAQYERDVRSTLYTELKAEPSAPNPEQYRVDLLRRMLAELVQD
jgi:signal recognition particle receptor subunit beta